MRHPSTMTWERTDIGTEMTPVAWSPSGKAAEREQISVQKWLLWLGHRVVRLLRSTVYGFKFQPLHCQMQPWTSCLQACFPITKRYTWYQPVGGNALQLGRCLTGHVSQTFMVLLLRAQGLGHGDEHMLLLCSLWWTLLFLTLPRVYPCLKKRATFVFILTLAAVDRFSWFFSLLNSERICGGR